MPSWTTRALLACDLHHGLALPGIVATRLLDVHVLARLAGQDRCRRVPMVGGCADQDIDLVIVQDATKILHALALRHVGFLHRGQASVDSLLIRVANIADLHVGLAAKLTDQIAAAAQAPSHPPRCVAANPLAADGLRRQSGRGGEAECGGLSQKSSSFAHVCHGKVRLQPLISYLPTRERRRWQVCESEPRGRVPMP